MKSNLPLLRAPACLLAAAAASLYSCAASSQTILGETRVTATRFAEPAASLPIGVSVITAGEIRASGAASVTDALVRILGIPFRQDLTNGGDFSVDLRGFGPTADSNQVVVLDGIRLSESDLASPRLAGIPVEAIERIEVLRGSGAVLYGEGATGGVIVITTKAGTGRQRPDAASVYAGAGSHALRDARANGTLNLGRGFVLDADAQKRRTKGHRANSASDTEAGEVTGQWSNGWLRLGARLGTDDLEARLPGALSAAQYAADPRQTTTPSDFGNIRQERAGVFATADLEGWQLALDAGRREKRLRSSFGGFANDFDVEAGTIALRARNEAKVGRATNILVLGVDRNRWERRNVTNSFAGDQHTQAFYAKDDVLLPTGTRVSAGARTEKIRKLSAGLRDDDRQLAWELGVSQSFTPAWTAYARVGRSFRLPNVDELLFLASPLRTQVSHDAELGARWNYGAGRMEARIFRSSLTAEIGFDNSLFSNVNFDPTRREGVELDWSHAFTGSFSTRVNAMLRDASFRSGPDQGKDVPLAPRKTLAVRADWTPMAGHRLHGGVNWVSSQFPTIANACRMPSYTTADARYAWEIRRNAELALGVTNLFDRKFYTQAFGCAGTAPTSIYPEPGRQATVSLRVQF